MTETHRDLLKQIATLTRAHSVCVDRIKWLEGEIAKLQSTTTTDTPIPDRESDPGLSCLDCDLPYTQFEMDLVLPRSQWLEINPTEDGLLCAACIVKRCAKVPGASVVHAVIEIAREGQRLLPESQTAQAALDAADAAIKEIDRLTAQVTYWRNEYERLTLVSKTRRHRYNEHGVCRCGAYLHDGTNLSDECPRETP